MALKRKAVIKTSSRIFRGAKGKSGLKGKEEVPKEDLEEKEAEVEQDEEETSESEEEEEEETNEEDALPKQEEHIAVARKKELKSMPVGDLKSLMESMGLDSGKKEEMINAVLAQDARLRAAEKKRVAEIKAVVLKKKEELESMMAAELKDLCTSQGITGMLSKEARVETLIRKWQAEDGVPKALAQLAREKLEAKLVAMDKIQLQKMCTKVGVDPFIKEIMVDRLLKAEMEAGRFKTPSLEEEKEEKKAAKGLDMVAALLAEEANKKNELELKKQQEEAAAAKIKGLSAMSVEQLKRALKRKKTEVEGNKQELIKALYQVGLEEQKLEARKAELKEMGKDQLKQLALSKGLAAGGLEAMVQTILDHEAQLRDELKTHAAKADAVVVKKKEEMEAFSSAQLKDMCTSKGLAAGVGKQDRVERLVDEARRSGEVDQLVASQVKAERRVELLAMDVAAVKKLCEKAAADPLVKEVMVDRLLAHEAEFGGNNAEPDMKKARKK